MDRAHPNHAHAPGEVDTVLDASDDGITFSDAAVQDAIATGKAHEREATFLESVLDALPANVAVLDHDGTVIAVNGAWRRFAAANDALDPDAYLGANYLAVAAAATGDDAETGHLVAERLGALLRGRIDRFVVEYPCHAPDHHRWFRMIATRPKGGEAIGAVVTHVDITDVVRSQRTLRNGERRMAAILDALGEGVCAVDVDGRIALLNPSAQRILGLAEGYGVGADARSFLARFGSDGAPSTRMDPIDEALREGRGTTGCDEWYQRANGERFPVEYEVAPLRDDAARVVGAVVTFVDAGPRRAIEASLAAARRLESLGQLTGGVAHDFNNLLTVIGGNAELLLDNLPDGPQRRSAELVRVAAERGATITQQLLAFGRRQMLEPRVLDLRALASELQELLQHGAGASLRVTVEVADDVWPVRVDLARLETALLNLVTNARDATSGNAEARVVVANTTVPPGGADDFPQVAVGAYVTISVSDEGTGIAEEDLARVFEPFFSTKSPTKGVGLGLATVHGFVHQSGGSVSVRSRQGDGTTFTLWLPHHVATNRNGSANEPVGTPIDSGTRLEATVLVVDDDALVRAYASDLLGRIGCVGVEAEGAVSALRTLEERDDIDLVLSDVVMPGPMAGDALAAVIRERWPAVAVVLTSGYDGQRADGAPSGASHLLPKPYGRTSLEDAIRAALARRDRA